MAIKWLLLFLLFDVADGRVTVRTEQRLVLESEEECEAEAAALAEALDQEDDGLASWSTCIGQDAFAE